MLSSRAKEKVKSKKARRRTLCAAPVSRALFVFFLFPFSFLLSSCRRDMQDQPKAIAYRENSFYKDGTGSRPLVEGTVPRGYLRENHVFFFGKRLTAADFNKQ